MTWQAEILTLFPEIFPGPLALSVVGKALDEGIWSLRAHDIRNFAQDKHRTVDDTPYGGGGGMVLKADVIADAIDGTFMQNQHNPIIYLSPRGELLNQRMAYDLVNMHVGINIICGRFEGLDERVLQEYKVRQVSVGDYVLSSGDIAAFVLLDACARLVPGVLGGQSSLLEESFGVGTAYSRLLEYPHYTKPALWRDKEVPEVLLSGNHQAIAAWRLAQAKEQTRQTRPDLWDQYLQGEKK